MIPKTFSKKEQKKRKKKIRKTIAKRFVFHANAKRNWWQFKRLRSESTSCLRENQNEKTQTCSEMKFASVVIKIVLESLNGYFWSKFY